MIAFTAKSLLTPLERIVHPVVMVEGGMIHSVAPRDHKEVPSATNVIDLGDAVIVPGFIDIHIHGGAGYDVMRADTSGFEALEQSLSRHGVSAYFPTTVTAPVDAILSSLERLANEIEDAAKRKPSNRAVPLGIHLEGPFISHARRGVHPPANLVPPTIAIFERFWQAARGHIALVTIAPELDGAEEVIAHAARRGVCVSMGHSDATLDAARAGVAAGARHANHTFNAMRPLNHRDPGILGEVLTNPKITADIIADGIHLDPTIVKLFLEAKGPDSAVLITDAISATDMPDGCYLLGEVEVEVKDGKCLANGTLAGSVLTMDRAVRNVMQFAGWDLQRATRLASLNPAHVMGFKNRGRLESGARADFAVLNSKGEVLQTVIGGNYS